VAVLTEGFIAVQTGSGEAYTRNGSLDIDATGMLRTRSGNPVLGDAGPIVIPPDSVITIGKDGTVSAAPANNPAQATPVGRIKLVKPDERTLDRGSDGLFRPRDGGGLQADAAVQISSGALEGSNVNAVEQLVKMIDYQRHYEMQIRLLQEADRNARAAAQIMTLS
jgi:flagellar basal-body rod protein FlgF